jgi:acetyl-CoA acyltransferase
MARAGLGVRDVDAVVWGGVILPSGSPNVGREIALDLGLDPRAEAMTVTRACASGLQAITTGGGGHRAGRGRRGAVRRQRLDQQRGDQAAAEGGARAGAAKRRGKPTTADYLGVLASSGPITDLLPTAAEDRRALDRRGDGRGGRAHGHAQRDQPGGAGRLRAALAPAGGGGHRVGALRRRAGGGHDAGGQGGARRRAGARRTPPWRSSGSCGRPSRRRARSPRATAARSPTAARPWC